MLPKIRCADGKVHLNDEVVREDFILHANEIEIISRKPSFDNKDLERLEIYEPETIIIGTGFKSRGKINEGLIASAKKQKTDLQFLPTPQAVEQFLSLVRKGKKVVAHIRVGD